MASQLSKQLKIFVRDINKNRMFLDTEARIKNPASPWSRGRSETLLSAYVTLSCGRFEAYLKDIFGDAAKMLSTAVAQADDIRLGTNFYWNNLHGFVSWSHRTKRLTRPDMIAHIEKFADSVVNKKIHPLSFQDTVANPNSATLKDMFNKFGVNDPIQKISDNYRDSKNRTLPKLVIAQNLDTFILRRNEAAHGGKISGATRVDIADDHVFLTALACSISTVLSTHISNI